MQNKCIIIDGPRGVGKSTIAAKLDEIMLELTIRKHNFRVDDPIKFMNDDVPFNGLDGSIHDRYHLTEMILHPSAETSIECAKIHKMLLDSGAIIVVLLADNRVLNERLKDRPPETKTDVENGIQLSAWGTLPTLLPSTHVLTNNTLSDQQLNVEYIINLWTNKHGGNSE